MSTIQLNAVWTPSRAVSLSWSIVPPPDSTYQPRKHHMMFTKDHMSPWHAQFSHVPQGAIVALALHSLDGPGFSMCAIYVDGLLPLPVCDDISNPYMHRNDAESCIVTYRVR